MGLAAALPLAVIRLSGQQPAEDPMKQFAAIHGNAGTFAVAGYRMGVRALYDLGSQRGSFALDVNAQDSASGAV